MFSLIYCIYSMYMYIYISQVGGRSPQSSISGLVYLEASLV